ncbi:MULTISPECIES: penicillin-binding protein 1A [Niveibacterium]|uniref:Penicillin-binding protein 1A n=1 Tax=Niveibacterium microcysteis TaxID=2811415 RepID=A0ABX7M4U1_9RHOO|nr:MULTISPECIES: penicillin-binding protein 1A [Niveibacterium]QSI76775.1 penicillin-binding protein 1A [Niveibacterium microcysteis]
MRIATYIFAIFVGLLLLAAATVGLAVAFAWPKLPTLEALTDYRPRIPLRVFTSDGQLIGEFGEERRTFAKIQEVPAYMKNAILAAEDDRFYEHGGIDVAGFARAAVANLTSGGKRQGASTITMQVARNFFLTREKSYSRKLYEILLSIKIEKNLSKDQILELYFNQIYLGQRAYGFAAAAQIYYGKNLAQLNVAEAAMLAGLPKAPSAYNPISNPTRATQRQHYVLRRMRELNYIDAAQYEQALKTPLKVVRGGAESYPVHGEYVAEMARQMAVEQFKDAAYTAGIRVITTIKAADQEAAYNSLRRGLLDYERRHAYRGAEAYVDMSAVRSDSDEQLDVLLEDFPDNGEMVPAILLEANAKRIRAYRRGGEVLEFTGPALRFVAPMLADNAAPAKRLRRGAVVRVAEGAKGWEIVQVPEVEGAFVAVEPATGAVRALAGGFDFNRNKFNHVTQAWRQPGSSFKPFIYSAALEKGYSPSSIVDDAPLSFSSGQTGSQAWEPKNYDGKYDGPMSIRTALAKSKNMVSIRLLNSIGPQYAQDYAARFGFDPEKHPAYLTMALGAGSVTPWQMAQAYSVFANGGYRVQPFIVKEMQDSQGRVLARTQTTSAGDGAPRVIDPRNAWMMDSMMKDVVRRGTATKALALKRGDLAGKTGTTNEYVDAWFCGYQPTLVGIAWIGYDTPRKLGSGETGGAAALPVWVNFMAKALQGVPEKLMEIPQGLLTITTADGKEDFVYEERLGTPPPETEVPADGEAPAQQSAPTPSPAPLLPAQPQPTPVPRPPQQQHNEVNG